MLRIISGSLLSQLGQAAEVGLRAAACSTSFRHISSSELAITNKGNRSGPGGRSSVSGVVATVFGANGFVGSYVVNELAKHGAQVVLPYRSTDEDVQHLKQMGDLGQMVMLKGFDISDEDMTKYALSRSNVVINLIGQRTETMNFSFEDVHVAWPERLAKLVAASPHVERLIHFSEMAASPQHPSPRMSTKAIGDRLLMQHVPSATIVKPGAIAGIEDHLYNYMIYQLSFAMVAPIIDSGAARLQPTWVHDVAEATYRLLLHEESKGQTYYLNGPETITIRQLYDLIIKTLRLHTDDTVHLPKNMAKMVYGLQDKARRMLPGLPMDNYLSSTSYVEEATHDSVAPAGAKGYADLGIIPHKVTEGLPLEPVRHYRKGGYRWGDMATVAKDVPENIRKFYNIK